MKKILFALTALCGLALFSCSKDNGDDNNPALDSKRYIKYWAADANGGELDGYVSGFSIEPNGIGQFNYKLPASATGQASLTWAPIAGDSIKVEFTCDLFPEYKFELRALANAEATLAPGIYYRIKKSDPADRVYSGTLTLD
jgi:hypothetical protein